MVDLKNSKKDLLEGLTILLRNEVDGWSVNEERGVLNVWPSNPPDSSREEYPRCIVDMISGSDEELDIDLEASLREVTVKVAVFNKTNGEVEDLIEKSEQAIKDHWDSEGPNGNPYLGDWTYREVDGFTTMNENRGNEGDLRYNRSQDFIFETIRT